MKNVIDFLCNMPYRIMDKPLKIAVLTDCLQYTAYSLIHGCYNRFAWMEGGIPLCAKLITEVTGRLSAFLRRISAWF
jgi:hypothetical protein